LEDVVVLEERVGRLEVRGMDEGRIRVWGMDCFQSTTNTLAGAMNTHRTVVALGDKPTTTSKEGSVPQHTVHSTESHMNVV
jgi:hypothetical protein